MKKLMQTTTMFLAVLTVLILCAVMLPNSAQAATVDDLTYEIIDDKVTITKCNTSASGALVIPETIEGYPVDIIGSSAFASCKSLTSVKIPNSVTVIKNSAFYQCVNMTSVSFGTGLRTIEYSAFSNCKKLSSITIPEGVTEVGSDAFSRCNNLTAIFIPASVTDLGYMPFTNCPKLTGIWVDPNNSSFSSDDRGVLYNKDKTVLVRVPQAFTGSYTIPNTVVTIGLWAMFDCDKMTALTIPNSVKAIYEGGIYCCSGLTSLTIPDSVTSIGYIGVSGCTNLTTLKIGTGITRIAPYAFSTCSKLKTLIICGDIKEIEESAFEFCDSLSDVYYIGTKEQWKKAVDPTNDYLLNATLHAQFVPTVVTAHPVSTYVVEGGTVQLVTKATGKGLTYQWEFWHPVNKVWSNALAPGNKTATIDIPVIAGKHGFKFRCKITDTYQFVTYSKAATLSVFGVSTQPVDISLPTGLSAQFIVKATGSGVKYQWQYRTSSSGSWTTADSNLNWIRVPVTAARNGYQYRCKLTDKNGNVVYTRAATLKAANPKVTAQPASKYLPAGKTAKFTVKATGIGLKYQWQYRTSATGSWKTATATGNKTASLSVTAAAANNGYQYRCKITDQYDNVIYSKVATLKIVTLKITTQPSSVTLAKGKTATFKVVAKGTGLKYQWQYRTSAKGAWKKATATGNKTATLKVPVVAARNGYQYRCSITDKYGNVIYSGAATLKVK